MKKTKNYAMPYPEQDDYFNVEDFQDMMVSVDDLMKKLSDSGAQISSDAEHLYNQTKAQMDNIQKRMNTFTALKDGSTTGDAELKDIRVAYDGKEYGNAGEAVREQASDIHKALFGAGASIWSKTKSESTKYVAETKGISILNERFTAAGVVTKISRGTFAENESTLNLDRECSAYIVEFEKTPGTVYMPSAETIKIVSTTKITFEANGNARCWIPVEKGQYLAVDSTATAYTCESNHVPYMLYDQANKTLEYRGFGSTGSIEPVDSYSLAMEYKLEYDMDDTGLVKQIDANREAADSLKEDLYDLVLKTKRNPLQLFNVNKVTDGRLKNDGTVDNNILYVTSRYEDISNFVGYYFASIGNDTPCAFYDEGGKLVQYFTDSRYYRNQIVPANSKYFKVSTAKSSANTFCFSVSNNKFNTVPTYNDYIVEKTELNPRVSVPTKQDKNVGTDNKGKILMVDDDGNIVYKDYLEEESKIIEYWGDSLTEGNQDNSGVTRATVLSSLVGSEWTVINNNDGGGEKSNTISCKACGTGIIAEPFTIPSSTDKVEVVLKDDIGYDCNFRRSSNMAESTLNPCIINGITGIISPGLVYGQNPYKFQRNESGNEVVLKRPIGVISSSARKQKGSVLIICIGQNTGWNNDGSLLVKQVKGIIEYYKSTRFLVIGIPHSKMNDWQIAGNDALKLEFGRHYIDVEEYMKTPIYDADGTTIISSYALDDCNLTPTSEDIVNIGQNKYPTQIMSDRIHFNRYGYTIWANLEYQRGKELGYWN